MDGCVWEWVYTEPDAFHRFEIGINFRNIFAQGSTYMTSATVVMIFVLLR